MPTTLTPLGYAPFGMPAITAAPIPPPPNKILSRYINPKTKDYQVGPTGELATMPVVRQKMLIALTTVKDSSTTLPEFGNNPPVKIDENYALAMADSVRVATKHIIDAQEARIDSVNIETFGVNRNTPIVIVSYTDLTTGQNDRIQI